MFDESKTPDDYSNYFPQWWERDLTSLVLRDRNHASVIIWSLGNEITADPNLYGPRMATLIRSLDKTRPVTLAGILSASPPAPYVDVADVHYAALLGDSTGLPVPASAPVLASHASYPGKPVTQSECFIGSIYDDWRLAQDNSWFVGNWVWAAWDYIGEGAVGAPVSGGNDGAAGKVGYPWFQAFCGDIDLIGQRRPQNYL